MIKCNNIDKPWYFCSLRKFICKAGAISELLTKATGSVTISATEFHQFLAAVFVLRFYMSDILQYFLRSRC